MRRVVALAVALHLLVSGTGCAALSVRPVRAPASPSQPVLCDTSPISPVFDVIGALTLALGSLFVMSIEEGLGSGGISGIGPTGLAGSAALIGSAAWGFDQGKACREARARSLAAPIPVIIPSPSPPSPHP